jgi:hypothetical protein
MSATWSGTWHPLAERFPLMPEDELREMAASISEIGQMVPCTMNPDGLGLDGRNRAAACALAGVEPAFLVYDGDPVAFIVQVNAQRRHLSTGQRAMATALGLVHANKRHASGRFARGSVPADNGGSSASAWAKAVQEAGVVLDIVEALDDDALDALADDVLQGRVALDAAHRTALEARKQRDRIEALGGELRALLEGGVIDLAEAERRADREARIVSGALRFMHTYAVCELCFARRRLLVVSADHCSSSRSAARRSRSSAYCGRTPRSITGRASSSQVWRSANGSGPRPSW